MRDVRREISVEQAGAALDRSAANFAQVLADRGPSPSAPMRQRERAVAFADQLAKLRPQYRDVIVLRNLQGLSFEEVADRMDRKPGTVRMLWLRAIEKLKQVYEPDRLGSNSSDLFDLEHEPPAIQRTDARAERPPHGDSRPAIFPAWRRAFRRRREELLAAASRPGRAVADLSRPSRRVARRGGRICPLGLARAERRSRRRPTNGKRLGDFRLLPRDRPRRHGRGLRGAADFAGPPRGA